MANPDLPQGHTNGHIDDNDASAAQYADQSRLERVLTGGSMWKKQTLRKAERSRNPAQSHASSDDTDTDKLTRMFIRLSAQLDERNHEIERLRLAISNLETEKTKLDRVHQRELESNRDELERLQNAYDQFEQESDNLISELGEQNERLLNECRFQNGRSLLKN